MNPVAQQLLDVAERFLHMSDAIGPCFSGEGRLSVTAEKEVQTYKVNSYVRMTPDPGARFIVERAVLIVTNEIGSAQINVDRSWYGVLSCFPDPLAGDHLSEVIIREFNDYCDRKEYDQDYSLVD